MPNQQIEHATPTRLSAISSQLNGRKMRVAGWLLHDDSASSIIMIHDEEDALLVDISLCLASFRSAPWLRENRTTVVALGYLEVSPKALPVPVLHANAPPVNINPHLVLQAIVVEEARDLDMALWNRAVQAQQETMARRTTLSEEAEHTTQDAK